MKYDKQPLSVMPVEAGDVSSFKRLIPDVQKYLLRMSFTGTSQYWYKRLIKVDTLSKNDNVNYISTLYLL